jgi:hypothetical protein
MPPQSSPLDRVLDALREHGCDPRRNGDGWSSKCPAHDDRVASLTASEGSDGRALVNCHAGDGCAFTEIAGALDLPEAAFFPPKKKPTRPKIVKTYPYHDLDGGPLFEAVRYEPKDFKQRRPNGSGGWVWNLKGVLRVPYRLPAVVETAQAGGVIFVVEGEKDADAAVAAGVCATTAPMGAGKWRETYSDYLRGAVRVVIVADRDPEGYKHARQVLASVGTRVEDVVVVEAAEGNDLSDHLAAGHTIDDLVLVTGSEGDVVDRVLGADPDEDEVSGVETPATAPPPPALAQNPQILNVFRRDVRRRGVVGEVAVACALYLVLTSRVLLKQVSAAVKGHTSSGKSWTVERTVEFFPPDAVIAMTAMSEHALVYMQEDLKHRTLVLYEATAIREGQEENHTGYFVRSLLSEGRICYPVVVKDRQSGQYVTRWVIKEGPTNLIVTTTKTRIHAENETRLLSFSTDDSKEQTSRIMAELANETDDDDVDLAEWRALQAWLATAEHRVTIPFASCLAELVPPVAVRLRRDFGAVLALIRAHAVLHQLSRERDSTGCIVATLDDYRVVRDLIGDVLAEGVGSTASDTIRETVAAIEALADRHEDGVPATAVAAQLDLDKSAARRRLIEASDRDYVVNQEDRRGRPGRWVVGEPLPEDVPLLPDPDTVAMPPHPPEPPPSPPETEATEGDPGGGGAVATVSGVETPEDLGAYTTDDDLLLPGEHAGQEYLDAAFGPGEES